jgi:hypothetical protein
MARPDRFTARAAPGRAPFVVHATRRTSRSTSRTTTPGCGGERHGTRTADRSHIGAMRTPGPASDTGPRAPPAQEQIEWVSSATTRRSASSPKSSSTSTPRSVARLDRLTAAPGFDPEPGPQRAHQDAARRPIRTTRPVAEGLPGGHAGGTRCHRPGSVEAPSFHLRPHPPPPEKQDTSIETRICRKRDCERTARFEYCSQPFYTTCHNALMAKLAAKPKRRKPPKQRTRAQPTAARRAARPAWCGTPRRMDQPTSFTGRR